MLHLDPKVEMLLPHFLNKCSMGLPNKYRIIYRQIKSFYGILILATAETLHLRAVIIHVYLLNLKGRIFLGAANIATWYETTGREQKYYDTFFRAYNNPTLVSCF
jgi:hypothetical protein